MLKSLLICSLFASANQQTDFNPWYNISTTIKYEDFSSLHNTTLYTLTPSEDRDTPANTTDSSSPIDHTQAYVIGGISAFVFCCSTSTLVFFSRRRRSREDKLANRTNTSEQKSIEIKDIAHHYALPENTLPSQRATDRPPIRDLVRSTNGENLKKDPIVDDLIFSLKRNSNGFGRQTTLEMLAKFSSSDDSSQKVIETLLETLTNDVYGENRAKAAESLGNTQDQSLIPTLTVCLENEPDSLVKGNIIEALAKLGFKDNIDYVIEMTAKEQDDNIRNGAILALGYIDDKNTVHALMYLLKVEKSDFLIPSIIISLGRRKVIDAYDSIKNLATKSSDECVRFNAVASMGAIKGMDSVNDLEKIFEKEPTLDVQKNILRVLGRIAHPSCINLLSQVINVASNDELRKMALKSLAKINSARSKYIIQKIADTKEDKLSTRAQSLLATFAIDDKKEDLVRNNTPLF